MSENNKYTPMNWQPGQLINFDDMDRIEQGIANVDTEVKNTIHFNQAQTLTEAQQLQARSNLNTIDATDLTNAQEYDDEQIYTVGDYCIHNNRVYRCITNIGTTEGWNPEHWSAVKVADEIKNTKNSVSHLTTDSQELDNRLMDAEDAIQKLAERKGISRMEYDEQTYMLYIYDDNEEIIGEAYVPGGGGSGGGGGGGVTYIPTLTANGERTFAISRDAESINLNYTYASVDDKGAEDGNGSGVLTVNNVNVLVTSVPQGTNILDIKKYLRNGSNSVRLRVENSEGIGKVLTYNITVVELNISCGLDQMGVYVGDIQFNYTVTGVGTKEVSFFLDDAAEPFLTETVTTSGRSRTVDLNAQTHGEHILRCYATTEINGTAVQSNTERISMIWPTSSSSNPIIASSFTQTLATQGDSIILPYRVYDPLTQSPTVTLKVLDENGDEVSSYTISRARDNLDPWVISNAPVGNIILRIDCRGYYKDFNVTVTPYVFPLNIDTNSLDLEFSADGRTNEEANPAHWSYGEGANEIVATFEGFNWLNADGWVTDANNVPVLRFLPNDSMTIPFMPFSVNARTNGYTIEVELATRDVHDYESLVISCFNDNRGFKITSQEASLKSEASSVSMTFKEDSRIRICFVIEPVLQSNRLIYIYINGIMCGAIQYPTTDEFVQRTPVGITIGAETCGLDLYKMRFYRKALDRNGQLDNYICDRDTLVERRAAYDENNILTDQEIDVSLLPGDLPYMIITCSKLPQNKADEITDVSYQYVDPIDSSKSFTATGGTLKIQGTSSAAYPVKNFKPKMNGGFTINGKLQDKYAMYDGAIPVKTFCLKADYASCEGANNVELVDLYEQVCREQHWLTPPQETNSNVRQGIAGHPIVVFYHDPATNVTSFLGKYNFNNDKSTAEVFGFNSATYPLAESWEFKNNTNERSLFISSDFSGTGEASWTNDFEARYPDTKPAYSNITRLQAVVKFVADHNRANAATDDEKAQMLARFKEHFSEHFDTNLMLFYYIFTEVFLMIDSRAKNMFLTTYDGTHWLPLPYDMDTALGINNEGKLAYDYDLEDTDLIGENHSLVFNGQNSVLWNNVRDAFASEIKTMYNQLRSGMLFNYEYIKNKFEEHQRVWPRRLWNEDAFTKYLYPLIDHNEDNLEMLQGDKSSQRDWWLSNAFKYRDSKYQTGEALNKYIRMRGYTDESHPISKAKLKVTAYSNVWITARFGETRLTHRMKRNDTYTFDNPVTSGMNDTDIYIYSADCLTDVGDLSPMNLGTADFSAAVKLTQLKIGKNNANYTNNKLTSLTVGNNELLTLLDISNCIALTSLVNLSGCTGIEEVYAGGSSITGVQLPEGGHLSTLVLPSTITNLIIAKQKNMTSFTCAGYKNLSTLKIDNTPNLPIETILIEGSADSSLNNPGVLTTVELKNVQWTATNENSLKLCIDALDNAYRIEDGNKIPQVTIENARVNIDSISPTLLERIQTYYPNLIVVIDGMPQYIVTFVDRNNNIISKQIVGEGENAVAPSTSGLEQSYTIDGNIYYELVGYTAPTNVHQNYTVAPVYAPKFRVRFLRDENGAVMQTKYAAAGGSVTWTGSTPTKTQTAQYTFAFNGWHVRDGSGNWIDAPLSNVQHSYDVVALWTETLRNYTVTWKNSDGTVLETDSNVPYGTATEYNSTTPIHPTDSTNYEFKEWSPAEGTLVTGNMNMVAQYRDLRSPVILYLNRTLENYYSNSATIIAESAFQYMTSLKTATTSATTIGQYAFDGCTNLQTIDFTATSGLTTLNANSIPSDAALTKIIIRNENGVTSLTNATQWSLMKYNTLIFVPDNLVSNYQSDTNWSIYAPRIRSINDIETTTCYITDSWEDIIAACNNGTYINKYNVGDIKQIENVNGQTVDMQIIAINTDVLSSDTSQTAHITWMTRDSYWKHKMNDTQTNANGYEASAMKTWLEETVWTWLPSILTNNILQVNKTYYDYTTKSTLTGAYKIWLLSAREIFGGTDYENAGINYTNYFTSDNMRKMNSSWWTRSANSMSTSGFRLVISSGSVSNYIASNSFDVVFGFCT